MSMMPWPMPHMRATVMSPHMRFPLMRRNPNGKLPPGRMKSSVKFLTSSPRLQENRKSYKRNASHATFPFYELRLRINQLDSDRPRSTVTKVIAKTNKQPKGIQAGPPVGQEILKAEFRCR